ncbi:MAG: hypothetical protein ACXAC5_04305 [Promethearchaeota archaeon]
MWFSRIIRAVTRSKVSHCYIRVHDEFLKTTLILHVEQTVRVHRAKEFDLENIAIEEFVIDDDRLDDSIAHNLRHLNKRFSWWEWFGWAPLIKKWFKTKVKSPTHSFKKMICVDYVLRVLSDADIAHLPYGVMTPELLRQWFVHYYKQFGWEKVDGIAIPNNTIVEAA